MEIDRLNNIYKQKHKRQLKENIPEPLSSQAFNNIGET
jgi:hypothetical protein